MQANNLLYYSCKWMRKNLLEELCRVSKVESVQFIETLRTISATIVYDMKTNQDDILLSSDAFKSIYFTIFHLID